MATLTVHDLDEELVRRLHRRAAERGSSAEAEHRDIVRRALLAADDELAARLQTVDRLADFRRRTGGRGSLSSSDLLEQSRAPRMNALMGA